MKKSITLLLVVSMTILLSGCSVNNSMNNANDSTSNATRSQRIQNISQKLDYCESIVESVPKAGKTVKNKLKSAQKAQKTAMEHLTDNESGMFGLNHDGDYYVDKFEASVQVLINTMNADSAVRSEVERQSSLASDGSNTDIFNGAASTFVKYFIMGAVFLIAMLLVIALIVKSARGKRLQQKAAEPAIIESKDAPAIEVAEEKLQLERKDVVLLETSDTKFEKECMELGHAPEEVKEFFNGNLERAKTYISMEMTYKEIGLDKDYRELSKEA